MKKVLDKILLGELAEKIEGELTGPDIHINGCAGIDDVCSGEITWIENPKALRQAFSTEASAFIISEELSTLTEGKSAIIVKSPRYAYARTLQLFYRRSLPDRVISPTAQVSQSARIGDNVCIGSFSSVGENSIIENDVTLFPNTYIGSNVRIGAGSIIYPFAAVHDDCIIGEGVILHSGAVIGADGFGFVDFRGKKEKIPQVGYVEIGNHVEIGSNSTVDRATTGVTFIGEGSKIDNLVQIGHNCRLGKNCIMVAHSGLAGSCILGDNVTFAAQAGTAPHTKIGSNTVVAGRGGVTHDIPANTVVSGFPAKPHKEALKISAALQRLPNTMGTIKELEKEIKAIEKKIEDLFREHEKK